jgi:hypothetical protein
MVKSNDQMSFEPRLARRAQHCVGCGGSIRRRIGPGAKSRYCSKRCRRGAKSDREFRRRTAERISDPRRRVVLGSAGNGPKTPINSMHSKDVFADRASQFSQPLDILGGGPFRWSETSCLDRETVRDIVETEMPTLRRRMGR